MDNLSRKTSNSAEELSISKKGVAKDFLIRFVRNKAAVFGLVIALILVYCALFPSTLTSYDPIKQDLSNAFVAPNSEHLFGTDNFGRDIFTRVVYGCRTSLKIGVISVAVSAVIGICVGSISGFYSGLIDNLFMRFTDILMAIPNTLLGISVMAALGPSLTNLIIAISIGSVPAYARLVRVSVQSVKEQEYVEAARATGAGDLNIILNYILPNCMAPIIVHSTMSVATSIMIATGLSFLGLGVPAPTPEWGSMASQARSYFRDYWWLVTFPGLAIMASAFSFNLLGDGLRDALDPKLRS